ncbi:ABC transporter ATP-binding protein [Aminipila sp.]|uniref:ABC transporter ATP-binding protein n=1 Tax=Aminipila sp. TaxID=2060095 RepID=UPI0028982A11|nr:ABC transporter ATP-binding protein [Aminipila sp.]
MYKTNEKAHVRISAEHVGFHAGGTDILQDITLQIRKGELVGLIGPNGCGKTTLLKNLYRVYQPSRGAVYLDGKEMKNMSTRTVARQLAVLAQEHNTGFDFPVIEIVLMGRYAHKQLLESNNDNDLDICEKALSLVGMLELKNRSFLSLSGGEKQRVLLAAAFAQEAGIIILDEPTNHLDIGYQLLIMDIIKERKDTTVLASIHDLNIAAHYCDRLIAMNHGEIIAAGSPEEVLTVPLMRDLFRVHTRIEKAKGKLNIFFVGAVESET